MPDGSTAVLGHKGAHVDLVLLQTCRLHGRAEVIIGKQRHGPIGTVELSFEAQFTRFGNLAKPWQAGEPDQF